MRLARETGLSSPVKYFIDRSKVVLLLWIICVILCPVFAMLSRLFITALRSPAGKGLTYWLAFLMFNCVFVTLLYDLYGPLGQVWYLIISIPDLCHLSYFSHQGHCF